MDWLVVRALRKEIKRKIYYMSRTKKDSNKKNYRSRIRLGKAMKQEAREHRKVLKFETNPKVVKRKSADRWSFD